MKLIGIVLTAGSILGIVATPTAAYQKFGDLMAEEGFEWIVDKWVLSPSSTGMRIIQYDWDLDRHSVRMSMERQENFKYRGMMTFNASQKKIVGMGADNMGGIYTISWRMENTTLVQRYERTGADGKLDKSEMICTKADSSTMKVDIYAMEEGDRRSSKPIVTSIYKRESEKASSGDSVPPPKDRDRKKD